MRIYNTQNGATAATIITNHSMTLDEAIALVGGVIHNEANSFDENVEINGKWYCYDDLDMDYADEHRYTVLEAYTDRWFWDADPDVIEDVQTNGMPFEEVERLSEGWGVSVKRLMEELTEV